MHGIHCLPVFPIQSGFNQWRRHVIAMKGRESLLDLLAAPVPVHVTPGSDVHQDIEIKRVTAAEFSDQFVIRPALPRGHFDRVLLVFLRPILDNRQNVAVRGMGDAIQQRGDDFVQRMMRLDEIHCLLVLPAGAREPVAVTGAGGALWDVLGSAMTAAEAAATLAARFEVPERDVHVAIAPVLENLRAIGALETESP